MTDIIELLYAASDDTEVPGYVRALLMEVTTQLREHQGYIDRLQGRIEAMDDALVAAERRRLAEHKLIPVGRAYHPLGSKSWVLHDSNTAHMGDRTVYVVEIDDGS
jgi:hypothetical protein